MTANFPQLFAFHPYLSPPVAVKPVLCSDFFLSSCLTHWQDKWSRGKSHRELGESVFKGVSTPNFCIIHITPQRWSISSLKQQSWAITWRDAAGRNTKTNAPHTKTQYSPLLEKMMSGIFPLGQLCVWLYLKTLLLNWLLGFDSMLLLEGAQKPKCVT